MTAGMSEPRPLLLLLVPPDAELSREVLRALQLHAGDQYGARLDIRPLSFPATGSRIRLIGDWGAWTPNDVQADLAGHFAVLSAEVA